MGVIKKNWKYLIILIILAIYIMYTFPRGIAELGASDFTYIEVAKMEGALSARVDLPKKVYTVADHNDEIDEMIKILDKYKYRKAIFIGTDVLGYDTNRKSIMLRFGNDTGYTLVFEIFSDGSIMCNGRNYGSGMMDKSMERELYVQLADYLNQLQS